MINFRKEIPARAFLNAAIIDRLVETDAFAECQQNALTKAGFASDIQYQYKNPAFIAGLLYCLIVVPKEIWISTKDDPVYQQLENKGLLTLFKINRKGKDYDNAPMYNLIHRLRNAVAHADFSIDQSQAFTFWDQREKDNPPLWEAWISNEDLMRFLSKLAQVVVFLQDDPLRQIQERA
jgi:hypothetical protein